MTARELVTNLLDCDKPVISAINGPAAGAGLAVALLADIPIMAEGAKLTDGHVRLGVAAGDHAVLMWPLACGIAKSKYLLMMSERIDAAEALNLGLVAKVSPPERLLDDALEIANALAHGSQAAIRYTKRSINQWMRMAQPAFEMSLALEMMNFLGPDVREGLAAFAEKRPPQFDGHSDQVDLTHAT